MFGKRSILGLLLGGALTVGVQSTLAVDFESDVLPILEEHCLICTKIIINAGIARVVYNLNYPLNTTASGLLAAAGVESHRQVLR